MIVAYIPEDCVNVCFTAEEAEYLELLLNQAGNGMLKRIYRKVKLALDEKTAIQKELSK